MGLEVQKNIRMSKEEATELEKEVQKAGLNFSEYIRKIVLDYPNLKKENENLKKENKRLKSQNNRIEVLISESQKAVNTSIELSKKVIGLVEKLESRK